MRSKNNHTFKIQNESKNIKTVDFLGLCQLLMDTVSL